MSLRVDKYNDVVNATLASAREKGLYAIVRVQDGLSGQVRILNGDVQGIDRSRTVGLGVSIFTEDGRNVFGSTDVVTRDSARRLVDRLDQSVSSTQGEGIHTNTAIFDQEPVQDVVESPAQYPLGSQSFRELEEKLMEQHQGARDLESGLSVTSRVLQDDQHWLVARSDGTCVQFPVLIGTADHKLVKGGCATYPNVRGIDASVLLDAAQVTLVEHRIKKAYDLLGLLPTAPKFPGGHYDSLLPWGLAGTWLHEAVGHTVESDLLPRSVLAKMMGRKVAGDNITLFDGPVAGVWGDVAYSMNGIPRREVAFVREGVLVDSLSDVYSADRVGSSVNGSGRAEDFSRPSVPRMSSTWLVDSNPVDVEIDPDYVTLGEIHAILKDMGKLADGNKVVLPIPGRGGQVMPATGDFTFGCLGAYIFDDTGFTLYGPTNFAGSIIGSLATPMRGIGTNLRRNNGGFCGKASQRAYVSDGTHPYLFMNKTEAVTFGGE